MLIQRVHPVPRDSNNKEHGAMLVLVHFTKAALTIELQRLRSESL